MSKTITKLQFLQILALKSTFMHCKPEPCKAYRELPVSQFSQGKPVFITRNPLLIVGFLFSLQGFPCKPLYFPVRDCSVETIFRL